MAVIQICQGQTELRIVMAQAGCGGGQLVDCAYLRLVITAPPDPEITYTMCRLYGCWPEVRGDAPPPPSGYPAVVYPAFEISDEAEIVFRLDDKLFIRPPGRYVGRVEDLSRGACLAELQLDICATPFIPMRISVNDPTCQPR